GRKVFSWTVPGDVELLQMGAAFASAAFFAYCHLVRGDVKVDFFTHNLGTRKVAALDALGSLLVGLFGALIAWRTAAGALGIKEVGETSAVLGLRSHRRSPVHADVAVCDARRLEPLAVSLRRNVSRPPQRRCRDGGDRRLRWIRRNLRQLACDCRDNGTGRAARVAAVWLFGL